MATATPSYTNGYSGSYTISIPNYLATGTGISIVFYNSSLTSWYNLMTSPDYSDSPAWFYLFVTGDGKVDYRQVYDGGREQLNLDSNNLRIGWNTVSLYYKNGALLFNLNGEQQQSTKVVSDLTTLQILLPNNNGTNSNIIAGVAYTKFATVNYPFNEDPNVTSYIDFLDPNNPKVYGDTTQLVLGTKSLTSATPIENVPAINITKPSSGNSSDDSSSGTNLPIPVIPVSSSSTISDTSSKGNDAILVGSTQVTKFNNSFDFVQKLTPEGLNARQNNDGFGSIISQGDGFLAVGVPTHSYSVDGKTVIDNTGAVWVFREQTDGSWKQETKLGLSENNAGVQFGFSVMTHGTDLYVGAPYYNYDANGSNESDDAGAVFHYTYDSTHGWTLAQTIVASGVNGRNANDWFGWSLDLSDTDLFIGAPGHQYNASGAGALDQAGAVFHFSKAKDGSWTLSDKIVGLGSNPRSAGDNFGSNVLFDGTRLLIQAKGFKFDSQGSNSITGAGAVFVINYASGSSVYEGRLISNNREANLNFGTKLDINNNRIVVSGSVGRAQEEFVFEGSSWVKTTTVSFKDLVPDTIIDLSPTGIAAINAGTTAGITGSIAASAYSPYGDKSSPSCYVVNSYGSVTTGVRSPTESASISMWTMYDNSKFVNEAKYNSYRNDSIAYSRQSEVVPSSPIMGFANNVEVFNLPIDSMTTGTVQHAMEIGFDTETIAGSRFPIIEGKWYHITVTYQNGVSNLFVNGKWTMSASYERDISGISEFWFSDESYSNIQYFSDIRYYADKVIATNNFVPPTTAYSVSNGSSQANVALYIDDQVAIGDTTITKTNYLNSSTYLLDQPASGAFLINGSAIAPKGRVSAVRGGSFGHKVKIKDSWVAVQAPADSTDVLDNSPTAMTGAIYTFNISKPASNAEKIVSTLRGMNSLYFADDFTITDSGDVTTYSPRTTSQISSILGGEYSFNYYNYSYFYIIFSRYSITGATETFGSTNSITLMNSSVDNNWTTNSTSNSWDNRSITYTVAASTSLTSLIKTDMTTGISYNYSGTTSNVYPGYTPSIVTGMLSSYTSTAHPTVSIMSPGTSQFRNNLEWFGSTVAISGDQVIIGSSNCEYNSYGAPQADWAAIFIFNIDPITSLYRQISRIDNTNNIPYFGRKLVATDTSLIVGGNTSSTEACVLYTKSNDIWTQNQVFSSSTGTGQTEVWTAANVGLGTSMSFINNDDIVLGIPYSDTPNTDSGTVLIASTSDGSTWTTENLALTGYVNARFANDLFGSTVSLDSNIAAIGAPGHDYQLSGAAVYSGTSGAVFTYSYNAATDKWSQQNIITAPSGSGITSFGSTLALKSNTMIVSNNLNSTYSFVAMTTTDAVTWTSTTLTSGNNSANYGNYVGSVALMNGTHAVIGVPSLSWPTNSNVGGFYTPLLTNGTWAMPSYPSENWTEDQGYNNGLYRIPLHTNGRLETNTIDYSQLMINGRLANDNFGTSVAISPDGKLAAVGIPNCHVSNSGWQSSYYGGLNTFYFDTTRNKWRFQARWSEAYLNSTTTGIGTSIGFYDGTHLSVGGTSQSGVIRNFTLTDETVSALLSLSSSFYGPTTNTGFGTSFYINGTTLYYGMPNYPAYGSWYSATTTDGTSWTSPSTTLTSAHTIEGIINVRNANDKFGSCVEVKGNRFWIGTPYSYTDESGVSIGTNTGSVYVYQYDKDRQQKVFIEKLLPSTTTNVYFGTSIEATDDAVIISGVPSSTNQVVSLYRYTADNQSTKISDITRGTNDTSWGYSVGLMDSTHVVIGGSTSNYVDTRILDTSGATITEKVIVPSMISKSTGREYSFNITSITNMLFGTSISSGNGFFAVGIPGWSQTYEGIAYTSGAVAIYSINDTGECDLEAVLTDDYIDGDTNGEALGTVIDADGDTVIIGTPLRLTNAGGYLIYRRTSEGLWDLVKSERFETTSSGMGTSVAVQGSTALVGVPLSNGLFYQTQINDAGISYLFTNRSGNWTSFNYKDGDSGSANSTTATRGGGGGSGARGGATYFINYNSNPGGGAGSNLIPVNGVSIVGSGPTPPSATDSDIRLAARGGQISSGVGAGTSGGHARIVINTGSSPVYFDYTGEDQTFKVPEGVTSITVKLWGAGGGGGYNLYGYTPTGSTDIVGRGGAGGFVSGTLAVTPGEILTLVVGQGGIGGQNYTNNSAVPSPAYGGGGYGGGGGLYYLGGSGGGRAEILRGNISLAIAGGGGGGGTIVSIYDTTSIISTGVPGGYDLSGTNYQGTQIAVTGNVNTRSANDNFGASIAMISDTELAIGAPRHDYDNNGQAIAVDSGAVMFFTRGATRWNYQYRINDPVPVVYSYFGSDLSTNGTTLAVVSGEYSSGYYLNSNDFRASTFGFHTYTKSNNMWQINGTYTASSTYPINSIAIVNDSKVTTGIPTLSSTLTTPAVENAGGFLTLDLADTAWTITTQSVAPGISFGRQDNDQFGTQVYMGAGWVVASAPGHSYSEDAMVTITGRGAGFVFHRDINTSQYVYEAKLFNTTSSTNFNSSGTCMIYSRNVLSLVATNNSGTYLSNWTRTNNLFGNMTTGSIDITTVSSIVAMDQNKYLTGCSVGNDYNLLKTGYWNYVDSNSSNYTGEYPQRIVVPGNAQGRNAYDNFGTGVEYLEDVGIIAVTAPGQDYTSSGSTVSKPGAIFTYYTPVGAKSYEYETKINNTGSQSTVMTNIDSKSNSMLVYGTSTAALYTRTKIGSWTLQNNLTNSSAMSFTLPTTQQICEGDTTSYSDSTNVELTNSGSVSVYSSTNGNWSKVSTLYIEGMVNSRTANDMFGSNIVMNSNYVMVAAPGHKTTFGGVTMPGSGAIWIYSRVADRLELVTMVTSPNTSVTSYGVNLSLADDNSYYAVGSPSTNTVYVFQFDGVDSTLVDVITPPVDVGTVTSTTMFGASVAIQNQDLLIGVPGMTDGTTITGGVARYENRNGTWTYIGMLKEFVNSQIYDDQHPELYTSTPVKTPEGDILGSAVALNNVRGALYGATGNTTDQTGNNDVTGAGAAWFNYLG